MLGIITCSVRHTVPYFLATVKSDAVRQVCRALNATTSYTTCYCNFCLEPTDTHSRRMSAVEVSCMQTEITSITVTALQQLAEIVVTASSCSSVEDIQAVVCICNICVFGHVGWLCSGSYLDC